MASVYLAYDGAGRLLYVGATSDFERRKYNHSRSAPWFASAAQWRVRSGLALGAAIKLEARTIRRFAPLHNVRGQVDEAGRVKHTKAGIAAKRAAGAVWGRKHTIKDYPRRMNRLRALDRSGRLRDESGGFLMSAKEIMDAINSADRSAPQITKPETIRRYRRDGWPGLELADEPIDDEQEA